MDPIGGDVPLVADRLKSALGISFGSGADQRGVADLGELGGDPEGGLTLNRDTLGLEFGGERDGELVNVTLSGAVLGEERRALTAGCRRNVDNSATLGLEHT